VSINGSQWDQAIYAYRLTDGSFKQVTENHWPAVGRVEWSPDGHGIFATIIESYSTSEQQIWFIPYPAGTARRITNDLADYRDFGVPSDASRLVTIQSEKKANIWLAPTDDLDHPAQLTATSYDGLNGMSWTPDGKLVYTSQIAGEQNIWITDRNHSEPKQLTSHAGFNEQPLVSPDGRYIVLLSNRNGQQHLWRIDIDGKHPLELSRGKDAQATFTADGQSIIFRSVNTEGSSLVRLSIDGGEPQRVTNRIAFDPNVSPDGKTLACAFRPEPAATTKIALLPIDGGEPKFISDLPACYGRLRWAPDGSGIAYAARQEGIGNIWIQPLDGSPAKQLTHWGINPIFSFAWSRDGKWLAYASGSVTSDVVVITDQKR
jgi:TolB protein